jgi:hypothetical protein
MTASRRKVAAAYLAGVVQGIVLVTFPAASTIFTDPDRYDLSYTRYGLGLGTALAPVFVAVFVGLGFWWALPLTSAILLGLLIAASLTLPLRTAAPAAGEAAPRRGIPARFWVFAAFAVL